MRLLRMILLGLSAGGMVMPGAAHAQTPTLVDFATISMSAPGMPRTVTNTICATDGRDLVCDRGAQLLPNGVISTTGLVVNGVSVTGGGGASKLASLTDVVTTGAVSGSVLAFNAATSSWTALPIQQVMSTTTMRAGFPDAFVCVDTGGSPAPTGRVSIMHLDYVEAGSGVANYRALAAMPSGSHDVLTWKPDGTYNSKYQSGVSDIRDCEGQSISALYAAGKAFNYIGSANGNSALGDRITSGTASGVVAMAGGTISFTTGGTSGTSYLDTLGRFIGAGVSTTGAVSAASIYAGASLQLTSPTAVTACNSGSAGTIRYNSPTTTLELCTGSGWQPMGVGIPAGTISAFASTTCPTGWSEYTAARGRFLRGIDNGAGNDPDGTRAPGDAQADALQNIQGEFKQAGTNGGIDGMLGAFYLKNNPATYSAPDFSATGTAGRAGFDASRVARTSTETRPKNVAVTFCQFNGTSNGWNNPLSGGSTVAAGSTGQVQYNTAGSFDASPDFSWSNGSKVLGVNGGISTTKTISTTDVYMAKSGGQCSTADDIGRMFRSATTGRLQICADRN